MVSRSIFKLGIPHTDHLNYQASTLGSKKKLALAIIDFLSSSLKDGTIEPEDSESVEIASSCIADIFHVDPSNPSHKAEALGQQNLLQIYSVYEKLKASNPPPAFSSKSSAGIKPEPSSSPSKGNGPAAATGGGVGGSQTTPESEKLKSQGNEAMKSRDYPTAIKLYTSALDICPTNPIYLSNRAAAYSSTQNYTAAASDAELAVAADPKYAKAWSRLGAARFALGDLKSSVDAYEQAIEVEGNGGSDLTRKGLETAKRKLEEQEAAGEGVEEPDVDDAAAATTRGGEGAGGMPDLSSLAGMFGGGGAGGGGGGMPDIGQLLQNPMMAQMAQNIMKDPAQLQAMMQNPQIKAMAEKFGLGGGAGGGNGAGGAGQGRGGGGGAPDFASMMQDPSIQEM